MADNIHEICIRDVDLPKLIELSKLANFTDLLVMGNACKSTLLHRACLLGHLNIVEFIYQYLLQQYDVAAIWEDLLMMKDHHGSTPLHCACVYGHLNIVEFIHQHTSNWPNLLSIKDNYRGGKTALCNACYYTKASYTVVEYLLNYGADPAEIYLTRIKNKKIRKLIEEYQSISFIKGYASLNE